MLKNAMVCVCVLLLQGDRLKRQLENTIYLSKLDALKDDYNFEKMEVNELIIASLKHVESVLIINEIDVYFEPKEKINLYVDREKFERALTNVLYNCCKYTKDSIFVESKAVNNMVEITVSDDGEGFPEKLLLNPFDGKIIGNKGGTGVGLTIIKKVVDNHGGKVTLSNRSDGGAVYTIVVPKI